MSLRSSPQIILLSSADVVWQDSVKLSTQVTSFSAFGSISEAPGLLGEVFWGISQHPPSVFRFDSLPEDRAYPASFLQLFHP